MEYKHIININQRAAVELGLDLDIIDLAIFDYIKGFVLSTKCMHIKTEDGSYYWVSHKNIQDAMPLLNIKSSQGIINRIKKLIDAGLLIKYPKCEEFGKTLYAFGPNYDRMEFFDTHQQNLRGVSTKLEGNNMLNNISPNGDSESISPILFEEENNSITTPYNPPSLTESERTFDEFRRAYKGTKRGLRTEFDNFRKKHKDWHDVLQHLRIDYENQEKVREENRKAGAFVPQPKNLSTYINQRCWEEEITPVEQKQNAYGNTINREAARLQAGVSCIRAGLNSANAERNPFEGVQG